MSNDWNDPSHSADVGNRPGFDYPDEQEPDQIDMMNEHELRKELRTALTEGRDREDAMYQFFRHIQDQIERHPGWMQFDFHQPEIDTYEFNLFTEALGDKSDAARWNDLAERFSVSSKQEPSDG